MRLIFSDRLDPYFHLAAELALVQGAKDAILMLWRSSPTVVCGKHQNACAEANIQFCQENNIHVARRISGGGTVFHDLGNVNFTFIKNLEDGMEKAVNYKQFLEPVRQVLASLGVETTYSHRDDLLLNGLKISGNAQHIYQKGLRVLHHGTLLYDSDLKSLSAALHTEGSYEGKSVPSNRSEVTNIRQAKDLGDTVSFLGHLQREFSQFYGNQFQGDDAFTLAELQEIEVLRAEKFSKDSWILGYSPKYTHRREIHWRGEKVELYQRVQDGIIQEMSMNDRLINECMGVRLELDSMRTIFPGISDQDLLQLF
jgi:lipoate-protein ligase A